MAKQRLAPVAPTPATLDVLFKSVRAIIGMRSETTEPTILDGYTVTVLENMQL